MAYFFVIGSARSGGTLVNGILCSDPDTNPVLQENHFVARAASVYSDSRKRLRHERGHFFADVRDTREFYSSWVMSFLEKVQSRYLPATHLVIKSTALSERCPELHDLVPSARFVMSVRDPRDIVASIIEVGMQQETTRVRNKYGRDVDRLASAVSSIYAPCLACRDPGFREKLHYVRYEHLVADPSSIVAEVQSWTGLDLSGYDPSKAWPRTMRDFDLDKALGAAFITESYGGPITSRSVGRFRSTLSAEETATVERICAPLMQTFGYPPFESN